MRRNEVQGLAVPAIDISKFGVADANGILQHGCKHRLKIAGRAADDLKHLRRGRLLLQRFREVGGAFGEVVVRWRSSLSNRAFSMAMTAWAAKFCDQLDLLVGKGTNFLAVHGERADQFVLLQHRDSQNRPYAPKFDGCNECRMTLVQCKRFSAARSAT